MIYSLTILAFITAGTLGGDYFIKLASSQSGGMLSATFLLGALLYGSTAMGWFLLMREHSLAMIGVMFSAMSLILLAAMGTVVFKEPFGAREVIGLGLAIASVIVMSAK